MKTLTTRAFTATVTAFIMAIAGLTLAVLTTVGDIDCRTTQIGGFCALRASDGAGVSGPKIHPTTKVR